MAVCLMSFELIPLGLALLLLSHVWLWNRQSGQGARRVEVDPNATRRKRKDLVFALELLVRLTSRTQRLLIGATIPLLFIEKHLNVNIFYLQGHRRSEPNAFCERYPANYDPVPGARA